jgi:hypothetical protein
MIVSVERKGDLMSEWNRGDLQFISQPEPTRKRDRLREVMITLALVIIAGATAGITIFLDKIQ